MPGALEERLGTESTIGLTDATKEQIGKVNAAYSSVYQRLIPEDRRDFNLFYGTIQEFYPNDFARQEEIMKKIGGVVKYNPKTYNFRFFSDMLSQPLAPQPIRAENYAFLSEENKRENQEFLLDNFFSHYFDRMPNPN